MQRRQFLVSSATASTLAVAGCIQPPVNSQELEYTILNSDWVKSPEFSQVESNGRTYGLDATKAEPESLYIEYETSSDGELSINSIQRSQSDDGEGEIVIDATVSGSSGSENGVTKHVVFELPNVSLDDVITIRANLETPNETVTLETNPCGCGLGGLPDE